MSRAETKAIILMPKKRNDENKVLSKCDNDQRMIRHKKCKLQIGDEGVV